MPVDVPVDAPVDAPVDVPVHAPVDAGRRGARFGSRSRPGTWTGPAPVVSTNAVNRVLLTLCVALTLTPYAAAQGGYYNGVDTSSAAALRASLHALIDDHTRIPYTSSATDTWDVLELAQQDPQNAARILDVYRNRSFVKVGGGNTNYEREHVWPKSYGFPDDDGMNMPYTDCHMLWLCDGGYNSARSNLPS